MGARADITTLAHFIASIVCSLDDTQTAVDARHRTYQTSCHLIQRPFAERIKYFSGAVEECTSMY